MLPLPQPAVSTLRSDAFRAGSSGTAMSCRLGMLTTIRLWAMCRGENFREVIFSMVGLLGLTSIPFNLGSEKSNTLSIRVRPQNTSQHPSLFSTRHPRPALPARERDTERELSVCLPPVRPAAGGQTDCPLEGTQIDEVCQEQHGKSWNSMPGSSGKGKPRGRACTRCSVSPQTEALGDEPHVLYVSECEIFWSTYHSSPK